MFVEKDFASKNNGKKKSGVLFASTVRRPGRRVNFAFLRPQPFRETLRVCVCHERCVVSAAVKSKG